MESSYGYLRMISAEPRTWRLFGPNGEVLITDNCIKCTLAAQTRNMKIMTIH